MPIWCCECQPLVGALCDDPPAACFSWHRHSLSAWTGQQHEHKLTEQRTSGCGCRITVPDKKAFFVYGNPLLSVLVSTYNIAAKNTAVAIVSAMATRVGLLRARGRARGAHLVCGQHQLCGLVSCAGNGSGSSQLQATIPGRPSTNNSRLRLLARLSSKSSADIGGGSNRIRHEAAGGLLTSAHKKYSPPSFLGIDSLSHKAALFSSNAKPSQDVEDDDEDWEGEEGEAGEGLDYSAGFEGFEGETKEERLARLDDGDQVWVCSRCTIALCRATSCFA